MACALICRGDLRESVAADKRYAKACLKIKYLVTIHPLDDQKEGQQHPIHRRAIEANEKKNVPLPAALWRTWGNAALKRGTD